MQTKRLGASVLIVLAMAGVAAAQTAPGQPAADTTGSRQKPSRSHALHPTRAGPASDKADAAQNPLTTVMGDLDEALNTVFGLRDKTPDDASALPRE